MSIYTRTGDLGETSLFGGKRVLKCEELVSVYGSIDELNCWVGLLASQITDVETRNFLQDIQSDLFTIGSILAGWKGSLVGLKVCAEDMEVWIDTMEKELPPLTNFILPGGSMIAGQTHLARAVCRKVERELVALMKGQGSSLPAGRQGIRDQRKDMNEMIKYLNRLSDLLFMLARYINKQAGINDVVWKGINRTK